MFSKLCVIACLLLNFGIADGIFLDISPNMTSSLFTANPTLTCSPDGLLPSSILYMKIFKVEENGNLPLATVSANNYLVYDNGTKDHEIRASGFINGTDLEKSYLKVTLMNPTRDQSGSYRCSVLYMNTDGSMKTDVDTADFVINEFNMAEFKGIIKSLKEQVDTVKGKLGYGRKIEELMQNQINQLTASLSKKHTNLKEIEKVVIELKMNIKGLETKQVKDKKFITELKEKMTDNLSQHMDQCSKHFIELRENITNELTSVRNSEETLKKQVKENTQHINALEKKHSADVKELRDQLTGAENKITSLSKTTSKLENENIKFKEHFKSLEKALEELTEPRCPDKTWTRAKEMCYKVVDGKENNGLFNYEANQVCGDLKKGSLVTIHDANTMNSIKTSVIKGIRDHFWIGLRNEANNYHPRNKFMWADNQPLGNYAPWAYNRPLAGQFKSYCVTLDTHNSKNYVFVDSPCRKQYRFKAICQIPVKKLF